MYACALKPFVLKKPGAGAGHLLVGRVDHPRRNVHRPIRVALNETRYVARKDPAVIGPVGPIVGGPADAPRFSQGVALGLATSGAWALEHYLPILLGVGVHKVQSFPILGDGARAGVQAGVLDTIKLRFLLVGAPR